jgi:ATP adenylyltransferase
MSLDRLWAGWRSGYVATAGNPNAAPVEPDGSPTVPTGELGGEAWIEQASESPSPSESCVFCRIAASGPPSSTNGVLWVGEHVFAVLNAYPYASGHLMVLPLRHLQAVGELTDDESHELWDGLRHGVAALDAAYGPEGINVGANLGRAAGAGIPQHLHLHAVPRWAGDTNFMTSIAETRVLPESIDSTWEKLRQHWPVP